MIAPRVRLESFLSLCAILLLATGGEGRAEEGGEVAMLAPLAERSLLLDAVECDGGIVAVGERGHVLVSHDGGGTWTQSRVPTTATLTAVAAAGRSLWAVGHDAVILHSGDAGATWVRQHALAAEEDMPLLDVYFADARRGLAVGAYGLALVTDDGGVHWRRVEVDAEERHLNAIAAAGADLYVAAEFGVVFVSRDGGATWSVSPTPYDGSLFGALALDGGAVLVFGLRGHVFRSDDAGRTWQRVDVPTEVTLLGGAELRGGALLVVGHSGTLLFSDDQGRHFSVYTRPDRHALAAAVAGAGGEILLFGEEGIHVTERRVLGKARP